MSSSGGESATGPSTPSNSHALEPPIYINWVHDEHRWRVVAGGHAYAVEPPLDVELPTSFEMRTGRGWAVVHHAAVLVYDSDGRTVIRER